MLSDVAEILSAKKEGPRVVQLGCIKIGGKGESRPTQAGGSFRLPVKFDHFSITTMNRAPNGDLIPDTRLMENLVAEGWADQDGKLRRIPVRVLSNEVDDILQAAWCWYAGKTCGARSDGKTVTWFNDPTTGKRLKEPREDRFAPVVLEMKDTRGNRLLKLHSIFNCVIAASESRFGGVYRFRSTSKISFDQLYSSLLHLSQLTGGMLIGMPLVLVVRPIQVAPDGKATTVHVVHCELCGGDMLAMQERALKQAHFMLEFKEQMKSTLGQYRKLLVGPGQESNGEAAEIADEFHPEAGEPEVATRSAIIDGEVIDPDVPDATDLSTDTDLGDTGKTDAEGSQEQSSEAQTSTATEDLSDWPTASALIAKAAVDNGVDAEVFDKGFGMALMMVGKKGKGAQTTVDWRRRQLDAIRAGKFDFKTGKIVAE